MQDKAIKLAFTLMHEECKKYVLMLLQKMTGEASIVLSKRFIGVSKLIIL